MIRKTWVGLVILGFMMNGCVNSLSSQINVQNKNLEKKHRPIRFYKTNSTQESDLYTSDWAGTKGKSIAVNSQTLYSDILKTLKANCGFNESDLVETRIVSHKYPIYYEVWVFNDKLSKREDKTSALSVVLTQIPNGGGVDVKFNGECHSSKPLQLIFTK